MHGTIHHGAACAALLAVLACALPGQDPLLASVSRVPDAVTEWEDRQRDADAAIVGTRLGELDLAALYALMRGDAPRPLGLDLFGAQHLVDVTRIERGIRHTLFHGVLRDGGELTLALDAGGAAAAAIERPGARYEILYTGVGRLHALHELDVERQARLYKPCCVPDPPQAEAATFSISDGSATPAAVGGGGTVAAEPLSPATIDVMAFYTPAARAAAGGKSVIEAQIAMRVGVASNGSAASGVNHRFRLVHVGETNYVETGTSADLNRFRGTADGHMDEVHALRDAYGGDLMALIINSSAEFCGLGLVMANVSTSFRTDAFSVTVRTCMSGHTLTHEMGHNMGAHHDAPNAGTGAYPYSHGFRTAGGEYRSIMAYSPGFRVNRWSGSSVTYAGFTLGAAASDNARSLNNVKDVVRQFKPTRVYEWSPLPGGIPGLNGEPTLTGQGTTNQVIPIRLTIANTRAGAPGALLLGTTMGNRPTFGGTLVPEPMLSIPLQGSGSALVLDASALADIPSGGSLYSQAFFVDAAAVQGVAASGGLSVTVP